MAILARRALWWVFALTAFLGAVMAVPQEEKCPSTTLRRACRASSPNLAAGLVLLGIASVALAFAIALRGSARQQSA